MWYEPFDKPSPMGAFPLASPEAGSVVAEDFTSFGWLKNDRDRAIMLEIRHADGLIRAIGYPWLESAEFNPSDGITLNFSGTTVKLVGRNLNVESHPGVRLFEGLIRHRVSWVQAVNQAESAELPEKDVVIDEVIVCNSDSERSV